MRKSSLAQFANESEIKEKFDLLMKEVKKLCISYGGLVLNPDEEIEVLERSRMFPISEWEEQYSVNEFSFRLYTGEMSQTYLDAFCKVLRGRPRSAGCNILAEDNGRLQERKLHRLNLFSCRECPFSRFRSISAGDVYTRVESDRRGEIDKTSALDAQKSERSNLSSITDACHDDTKLKHKR